MYIVVSGATTKILILRAREETQWSNKKTLDESKESREEGTKNR